MGVYLRVAVDTKGTLFFMERKKKVLAKNIVKCASDASRILFDLARNAVTKSSANYTKKKKAKLFTPSGKPIKKTKLKPSDFVKGKSIGRGTMKGKAVSAPTDTLEYKWTRKQGKKTKSHDNKTNNFNYWLRNRIRTAVVNNSIVLYINPTSKGPARNWLPTSIFEEGGSYPWQRKIPIGYRIETNTHAHTKGGGKLRAHKRRYKTPRVSLRREFLVLTGTKTLSPRPFLAPAVHKFFEKHFGLVYRDLFKD